MAGAVLDVAHKCVVRAELFDDETRELDVLVLLSRTDVVDLACFTLPKDELDRGAVVVDVQPVAHLSAVAVER